MAKRSSTCVDKVIGAFLWRELQGQPVSGILTGRRTESLCCPQVLTRVTFWGNDFVFQQPHPWGKTPAEEERNVWSHDSCVDNRLIYLKSTGRFCLFMFVYGRAGSDLDLHLFSSSNRTWLMICPRSWAGTSGVWFWVCSCWPLSMIPTSSGTRWRFSSILHAKYQILSFMSETAWKPLRGAFFSGLCSSFKTQILQRLCYVCAPVWQPLAWPVNPPVFVPGSWDWRSLSHRYSRLKDEWWN